MKRRIDPLRMIVSVEPGAGTDRLTMECGHKMVRDHKPRWGKQARCHGCRQWTPTNG